MPTATRVKTNITLLYVEDEEIIRDAIERLLRRKFSNVLIAKNGAEGLEFFKKNDIDIVVSDIKMPKMTGLEMAKEIKAINPEIPIIFTTAHTDFEFMSEAIEVGVEKYITKPIDLTHLENTVKQLAKNINLEKNFKIQENLFTEYKHAVDSSAIVSKTDKSGFIIYVNDKFCEISGYSKEELLGKPHNIVRDPSTPRTVFKKMWEMILNKEIWSGVLRNRTKDGKPFFTSTTITPILNRKGEISEFISIRYDITAQEIEKRKKEKSIIQSKTKLFEVSKQRELVYQHKLDDYKQAILKRDKNIEILKKRIEMLEKQNRKLKGLSEA
jgi:PAS domain S-box-containing protein